VHRLAVQPDIQADALSERQRSPGRVAGQGERPHPSTAGKARPHHDTNVDAGAMHRQTCEIGALRKPVDAEA
jgi:hypothetical protein